MRVWVSAGAASRTRQARACFVASLLCGLVQKRTIEHAWDVQATASHVRALLGASSDEEMAGQTLILLRQVYARRGQAVVGRMSLEIAGAGRRWSRASMSRLLRELKKLQKHDARKSRGRGVLWSGPRWIEQFLLSSGAMDAFRRAARALGHVLVASSKEESLTFGTVCDTLQGSGKLPGVAKYGLVGLARAAFVAAPHYDPSWVEMDERAWSVYLQRMSSGTVAPMFMSMEISNVRAAMDMLSAIRQTFAQHHGSRLSMLTSRCGLIDLPCLVCEHAQVLDAVVKADVGIHDRGGAVSWLLSHLPSAEPDVRHLAKALRIRTQVIPNRGDGQDLQCGGCVAERWIRNFVKSDPEVMALSATRLRKRAASVQAEMTRRSGTIPVRHCKECEIDLLRKPTHRPRGLGQQLLCRGCYLKRRRSEDAERKRQMRRRLL